jgi:sugar phosphate isomerase/epimerase
MKKLGINTYTFMWSIGFKGAQPDKPMTAVGLLEKARELGVSVLQVGPNLPLAALPEPELDRFAQQARDWDIELELGTRGIEADHLRRQVALARRIGASLLRTIPEVSGATPDMKQLPHYLRDILPVLNSDGVTLGLENGKIPAEELRSMLEDFGDPHLGIVLDTVNSLAVPEGWKHVTKVLAPYTVCLHFKDFVVQRVWHMMGFTVEGRPAGKGQVDTPWLLNTLRDAGARFNVILELWPPEQKTLRETIDLEHTWAAESIPYLRQYVKD